MKKLYTLKDIERAVNKGKTALSIQYIEGQEPTLEVYGDTQKCFGFMAGGIARLMATVELTTSVDEFLKDFSEYIKTYYELNKDKAEELRKQNKENAENMSQFKETKKSSEYITLPALLIYEESFEKFLAESTKKFFLDNEIKFVASPTPPSKSVKGFFLGLLFLKASELNRTTEFFDKEGIRYKRDTGEVRKDTLPKEWNL